ncbi:hypothetical protein KL920_004702 [Ogataea angusta]|nr:hypothetical protein KL920_004702 [Ogataea angusta]
MSLTAPALVALLNKEFKPNIEDILAVYGDVTIDKKIKNIKVKEVELDHVTLVFNHDDLEVEMLKPIPFKEPLESYEQVQSHVLSMAREAASKRNVSHLQVRQVWYPQTALERILVVLVSVMMVAKGFPNLVYDVILSRVLPVPNEWIQYVKPYNDFILVTTVALHAVEVAMFLVPRFFKYRVAPDYQIEWLVLTTVEGYPSIRRFDRIVAERAKLWKHYEEGGKLIPDIDVVSVVAVLGLHESQTDEEHGCLAGREHGAQQTKQYASQVREPPHRPAKRPHLVEVVQVARTVHQHRGRDQNTETDVFRRLGVVQNEHRHQRPRTNRSQHPPSRRTRDALLRHLAENRHVLKPVHKHTCQVHGQEEVCDAAGQEPCSNEREQDRKPHQHAEGQKRARTVRQQQVSLGVVICHEK